MRVVWQAGAGKEGLLFVNKKKQKDFIRAFQQNRLLAYRRVPS
jgi:hypothetical protein